MTSQPSVSIPSAPAATRCAVLAFPRPWRPLALSLLLFRARLLPAAVRLLLLSARRLLVAVRPVSVSVRSFPFVVSLSNHEPPARRLSALTPFRAAATPARRRWREPCPVARSTGKMGRRAPQEFFWKKLLRAQGARFSRPSASDSRRPTPWPGRPAPVPRLQRPDPRAVPPARSSAAGSRTPSSSASSSPRPAPA